MEQLPEGEVNVRLELLGEDRETIETMQTVVSAEEHCGCRAVNLQVTDGTLAPD
jgi:hypothetical protein